MNLSELQEKLLATARQHPPADSVPFAFETRVLARLRTSSPEDSWALWGQALWRAALACLALAILLSGLSLWPGLLRSAGGEELDTAVLAMADQLNDSW